MLPRNLHPRIDNFLFQHPLYQKVYTRNDDDYSFYDLLLLKLSKEVVLSKKVQVICLPLPDDRIDPAGTMVVATGWGKTSPDIPGGSKRLKMARLTILSEWDCRAWFPVQFYRLYRHVHLCAQGVANMTFGICNGDSGGKNDRDTGVIILRY